MAKTAGDNRTTGATGAFQLHSVCTARLYRSFSLCPKVAAGCFAIAQCVQGRNWFEMPRSSFEFHLARGKYLSC